MRRTIDTEVNAAFKATKAAATQKLFDMAATEKPIRAIPDARADMRITDP
tara:strand:- start:73 stop:222 length:150 start_codon:yes stop_codon:yes gene_type:complete